MTIRSFLGAVFFFLTLGIAAQSMAQSDPKALIDALGTADFKQAETLIGQIAATGDARVVPALEAFASGELYVRKADNLVFMTLAAGSNFTLIDPLSGETVGEAPKAAVSKIRVNNNLRRVIRAAMGGLTLLSPEKSVRLSAADAVLKAPSAENLELLEAAIAKEADNEVRTRMEEARAVSLLSSDRSLAEKKDAIATIKKLGGRDAIGILMAASSSVDQSLKPDIDSAISSIESSLAFWDYAQNV